METYSCNLIVKRKLTPLSLLQTHYPFTWIFCLGMHFFRNCLSTQKTGKYNFFGIVWRTFWQNWVFHLCAKREETPIFEVAPNKRFTLSKKDQYSCSSPILLVGGRPKCGSTVGGWNSKTKGGTYGKNSSISVVEAEQGQNLICNPWVKLLDTSGLSIFTDWSKECFGKEFSLENRTANLQGNVRMLFRPNLVHYLENWIQNEISSLKGNTQKPQIIYPLNFDWDKELRILTIQFWKRKFLRKKFVFFLVFKKRSFQKQ